MINVATVLTSIGVQPFRDVYDSSVEYYNTDGTKLDFNEWAVYTLVSETPQTFADNVDYFTSVEWYVNYYSFDLQIAEEMKLKMRDALRDAGFIIVQTRLSYEDDSKMWHLTLDVSENDFTQKYGG